MSGTNISISQRGIYSPSRFSRFLWWLSTSEEELIIDTVIDRNRMKIVGMSVLATWLFATLAWTYFFSTIISQPLLFSLLGLFMGLVILTIDRALIKGINKFNKRQFIPLIVRGLLALTIGTFMAQPAILYMFAKEIKLQISLDNEKKKIEKRDDLTTLNKNKKEGLLADKKALQAELSKKDAEVAAARASYISEADGSGGTGKIGIKKIALAKKTEYEKLGQEYSLLQMADTPKINTLDREISSSDLDISIQERQFEKYFNDGFLTQIQALNNLIKNNSALQFRYYLLVAILMLIELMPVIAKSLLPSGTYDEKVRLREEHELTVARSNILKEEGLKEMYNQLARENDEEAIRSFFVLTSSDKKEKIKSFSEKWKSENHQTFDGLWGRMKREILSKQEN